MAKDILFSRSSLKMLRRMPRNDADRIIAKVRQYATEPESLAANVKALQNSNYVRLQVGDWRVIMDETGNVIEVVKIGARGNVYE